MIKKSILTALVLLGTYHLLLPHLPRKFYQIPGQQRGNYLRAQRYIFDTPENINVIVGSSMALSLDDQILGPDYFKLTFPGGSITTALEIIRRSGKRPPVILIETNLPGKDKDEELLHDLFSPWLFQLRRHSDIFKEEGRPANFVGGIAEACVRKGSYWASRIVLGKAQALQETRQPGVQPDLRLKMIRVHQDAWKGAIPAASLARHGDELANYVALLSREGCQCVFFEMPMDSTLIELPLPTAQRRAMKERFPEEKYRWLSFERDHNYETRDGIHLVEAEARRLTQAFVTQVNQVTQREVEAASNARNSTE